MNIIIQCQGRKRETPSFVEQGKSVKFVAQPALYKGNQCAVTPEIKIGGTATTWRDHILALNEESTVSEHLLPASTLYQHDIYRTLPNNFGVTNTYILSAGWGLVRSDFRLPNYDITFSQVPKSQKHKYRSHKMNWHDFNQLNFDTNSPLVFFGSNSYLPSLLSLTDGYKGEKFAFCAARSASLTLEAAGYKTLGHKSFTNWHYAAASKYGTPETLTAHLFNQKD